MEGPIHFLDITVTHDRYKEGILDIIARLRREWRQNEVKIEDISGGIRNKAWCCYRVCDLAREDALVIRVHGDAADGLASRDTDFYAMQLGSQLGCFPPIYAGFQNGVVYKYAVGRVACYRDLIDAKVIRDLTVHLQRIHATDCQQRGLLSRNGDEGIYRFKKESAMDYIRKLFSRIPECKDPLKQHTFKKYRNEFSEDIFLKECTFMENMLDELKLPFVLSHNDVNPANLIINDEKADITLLDFEFMATNYAFFDMGFMFVSWETGWCDPNPPPLTDELRDTYVRSYLRARYESRDENPDVITEKEVEMSLIALKITETAIYLRFVARSLYLVNVDRFDMLQIYPKARDLYYENKPQMQSLLNRYSELKAALEK